MRFTIILSEYIVIVLCQKAAREVVVFICKNPSKALRVGNAMTLIGYVGELCMAHQHS
jgi:hypothetical protein